MLRAEPSGNLSWSFKIFEDNRPIGTANFAWFQGLPQPIVVRSEQFTVDPLNIESNEFVLHQNGSVIAKTRLNGGRFHHRFYVDYGAKSFEIRPDGWSGAGLEVIENKQKLGAIQRTGRLTRNTQIDLPKYIPTGVRAFILGYGLNVWAQTGAA
ncbi:MAG: hypothetical protein B6D39_01560 [Anaerolineae bacterium UTCFX2]|jgi:hypothetical protein|nr:hypothetical protein [Anaerolineales bacterium]OQY94424.1 MAG: hypothetical protein B6D39_01560 [Anaerolineae bacterium UTCFX2]